MTTFVIDGTFVLDEVLRTLVPVTGSSGSTAARDDIATLLLEQQTRVACYFDATTPFAVDGPSRVPVSWVPVTHPAGVFHPKVMLVLTEQDDDLHLVVCVGSANLTKAGWWSNLECAHITTLHSASQTGLRAGLVDFLAYLTRQTPSSGGQRDAVARVTAFVQDLPEPSAKLNSHPPETFFWKGVGHRPGLVDTLHAAYGTWATAGRLEIVSPWFTNELGATTILTELHERLAPAVCVMHVPTDDAGACRVPASAVESLSSLVRWGRLEMPRSPKLSGDDYTPRHLHAKVMRLTRADQRGQVIVVGSINLTPSAMSAGRNVEAAIIVDTEAGGRDDYWVIPRKLPATYSTEPDAEFEEDVTGSALSALHLTFDWSARTAGCGWDASVDAPRPVTVTVRYAGTDVLAIAGTTLGSALDPAQAAALERHLMSRGPVLDVVGEGGVDLGYVLVHEEAIGSKPTVDSARTLSDAVADMLLAPERKRQRDENREGTDPDGNEPGDPPPAEEEPRDGGVFAGYAALYEALAGFEREIQIARDAGRHSLVDYRLTGSGTRCLGDLLDRAEKQLDISTGDSSAQEADRALLVCWGVEDVLSRVTKSEKHRLKTELGSIEARTGILRERIEALLIARNGQDPRFAEFLAWGHSQFLAGR